MPLVSVAVVAYNQRPFLPDLIDSILAQDYANVEVIVADDASTDGTPELRGRYEVAHPGRIIWLLAPVNGGVTANSNAALKACTGEFICLVGGDDVFLPGKISAQVDWFERNPEAALCGCGVEVFDSTTGRTIDEVHDSVLTKAGGVGAMIRQRCATPTSAFMFRRSLCVGLRFDPRTPVVSDWLFIIEACMRGRYGRVDGTYLRYRLTGMNVTRAGAARSHIEDRLIYTDLFFTRYETHFLSIKIQRGGILYHHGKRCGYDGEPRRAAAFMCYSLIEWPFQTRAIMGLALCSLALFGINGWVRARDSLRRLKALVRSLQR
jgi:glycosyltransferase involved in cell wall biosynthesis